MVIKSLYVGQEFKDLTALFLEVGYARDEIVSHRRKITNELKRYIKWSKKGEGYKITITEIYDIPKEKVNNTGKSEGSRANNDKYQKDMSILIEHYLATMKSEKLEVAISTLAIKSKIVSADYIVYKNNMDYSFKKLKSIYGISNRTAFNNAMYNYYYILDGGIYGALNSLIKQHKLKYEKTTFVVMNNNIKPATKEMNEKLSEIKEQVMNDTISIKLLTKKEVMKNPSMREKYYYNVSKEFSKVFGIKYFEGVTIYPIDCKSQENIIEVSNRINNTLKENVLEKNKKQVYKVNRKFAFGEKRVSQMQQYERDILEKSYIEDTITLTNLLCGKTNHEAIELMDTKEKNQEVKLLKHIVANELEKTEMVVSTKNTSSNENKIIEITQLKDNKYLKDESMKKASIHVGEKTMGFGTKPINISHEEVNRSEDENIDLNTIAYELLKEMHEMKVKIDWIECGFKEGNLNDLYKQLDKLKKYYFEVDQLIIDSCSKYNDPMIV